jgi:DNA-binding transcriptional regulator/RsmH inhibitor MraZ
MIPPHLMKYASLDKEVVVSGSGRYLEIWDRGAFHRYSEDVLRRIPDITESFANTT